MEVSDVIQVFFFPIGHTHENTAQKFSPFSQSQVLRAAISLFELHEQFGVS